MLEEEEQINYGALLHQRRTQCVLTNHHSLFGLLEASSFHTRAKKQIDITRWTRSVSSICLSHRQLFTYTDSPPARATPKKRSDKLGTQPTQGVQLKHITTSEKFPSLTRRNPPVLALFRHLSNWLVEGVSLPAGSWQSPTPSGHRWPKASPYRKSIPAYTSEKQYK